jgi:hypothetical protein
MNKHWDIIPPKKKETEEDRINQYLKKRKLDPNKFVLEPGSKVCLHKECPNCHGTGVGRSGSACIHGISCPCEECLPIMLENPNPREAM